MPYHWTRTEDASEVALWTHQSLTGRGFAWFVGASVVLLAVPLIAVVGSSVLWVLLGFVAAAVWGVWRAIMANRANRRTTEILTISADSMVLEHKTAKGELLTWQANPYWVRVDLHEDQTVPNYLTLAGGPRRVELGAFLTPDERLDLKREVEAEVARMLSQRGAHGSGGEVPAADQD